MLLVLKSLHSDCEEKCLQKASSPSFRGRCLNWLVLGKAGQHCLYWSPWSTCELPVAWSRHCFCGLGKGGHQGSCIFPMAWRAAEVHVSHGFRPFFLFHFYLALHLAQNKAQEVGKADDQVWLLMFLRMDCPSAKCHLNQLSRKDHWAFQVLWVLQDPDLLMSNKSFSSPSSIFFYKVPVFNWVSSCWTSAGTQAFLRVSSVVAAIRGF